MFNQLVFVETESVLFSQPQACPTDQTLSEPVLPSPP
jgi:hypothetical protein